MVEKEKFIPDKDISPVLEFIHTLSNQFSFATAMGAIAAARTAGFGDKKFSDQESVAAMREYLNQISINGTIVIGEGERDEAPMLYIGENVGRGNGPKLDIAVDPLENTNATAIFGPRAISTLAVSEENGLFHAPDMYMNKLVVGPEAKGRVNIEAPVKENLKNLAKALHRKVSDLVIVVLDRKERNGQLINEIRTSGARVKLIPDGDLMPAVLACLDGSGIHAVMGIGAAPEGVISAAGVRCLNGEMQAKFWPDPNPDKAEKTKNDLKRLAEMGGDVSRIYTQDDLASGKTLIFCASGVTDGDTFRGVRFFNYSQRIDSLIISKIILNGQEFFQMTQKNDTLSHNPTKVKFELF